MPWHVRVHKINTGRTLHLAEGSFSAPDSGASDEYEMKTDVQNAVFYHSRVGITGLVGLSKELTAELSTPEPNTNLYFNKTKIPLQTGVLEPGQYTLVSLYLGDRELESLDDDGNIVIPEVKLDGNKLTISFNDHTVSASFDEF